MKTNKIKTAFLLISLYFSMNVCSQQCNYITSGYYTLINQAEIAFEEGDKELAYDLITKAKEKCKLIQQTDRIEIKIYIELLIYKKKYKEAIFYLKVLSKNYGYSTEYFESRIEGIDELKKYTDWAKLKKNFNNHRTAFYADWKKDLAEDIKQLYKSDQAVRTGSINKVNIKQTDDNNLPKIIILIKKYGFPSLELLGYDNLEAVLEFASITIHYFDNKVFEQILLSAVENGQCQPFTYGAFIDKQYIENKRPCLYKTFSNLKSNQIFDEVNLDTRRLSIGMPTVAMEKRIKELFFK